MPPEGSGIAPEALHRVWARIPQFCAILGFRSRCQAVRDGRFEQHVLALVAKVEEWLKLAEEKLTEEVVVAKGP